MKVRLPRQELLEALQAVSLLTAGRTTRPILSCVRLEITGETLELATTDGESALRLHVACLAVERPGRTVVGADRLLQIIRELPDVEVALRVDDRHCIISGQGSEFKIFVQSADDFPPIPAFEDEPDLTIDGRQLGRMISHTLYAAARETSRYAINGVLWQKEGKRLFLVATDGRRLARAGGLVRSGGSGGFEVIIPAKALNVFERIYNPGKEEADATVEIKILPTQVMLRFHGRVLSTALVDGHFPKYQEVIPKENDKRVVLDRAEFHGAIRRAALLTTEDSRAVRLAFEGDKLTISSNSPEQGEARVEMPLEQKLAKLEIGFNPAYLIDPLKVLTGEKVTLELGDGFKPGMVCADDKDEFLYVIMPVTLS